MPPIMEDDNFENPRSLSAEEMDMLQRQTEMTAYKKNKLEIEAQRNWDKFYGRNGSNFFKDRHWTRHEFEEIFDDINLKEDLIFLEAGCGVGNMLFPLCEYFPNWKYFGFDFSTKAVDQLIARAKEANLNVCAKVLDITAENREFLGFPPADLVTFIYVLSALHPDKFDQAIQNLATFIKPGGSVFIRDYGAFDHAMIRFGKGNKIADRFYSRQDGTRAFYFYKEELQSLFERNGFATLQCNYLFKKTTNYEKKLSVDRIPSMNQCDRMNMSVNSDDEQDPSTSWLFTMEDLDNTPSRRVDVSEKDESSKRRKSVKMIREIGNEMKLSMRGAIATANVYFHRFYMFHTMLEYPPRIAVLGCLFLAGKVEETPKKCRDLLSTAQNKYPTVYSKDSTNDVMNFEKMLLHTLRFDLQVEHPYQYLLEYIKVFQMEDSAKQKVATCAWTFVNDSYSTTLCLMWEPEIVAIALLQLAINMSLANNTLSELKYSEQNTHVNWWDHFVEGLQTKTIEVIEQIIKDYYTEVATP